MNEQPTNISGAITAATARTATAAVRKTPSQMMNAIVSSESTKKLLESSLKENAGAFAASVIDLYNTDTYLQKCDPKKVFGECLKAVSLKLPINKALGYAYIIPFFDGKSGETLPQFQIGYKGYIQMAMRTGAYKFLNAGTVYEGETVTTDKVTGDVQITGEPVSESPIGYFAYLETVNGFKKALYWTKEKLISHVTKFSKSYKKGSGIWKDNFDAMAVKTVLRNLLTKWGVMSVEMVNAVTEDRADLADKAAAGYDLEEKEPIEVAYADNPEEPVKDGTDNG